MTSVGVGNNQAKTSRGPNYDQARARQELDKIKANVQQRSQYGRECARSKLEPGKKTLDPADCTETSMS